MEARVSNETTGGERLVVHAVVLQGSLLEGAIGKCCGAPTRAPLTRPEAEEVTVLLKAVSDPARLQLLSIIRSAGDCSACVCDLTPAVGLSQPTVSHHLKVLTKAGLVTRDQRGTQAWFTLVPERLAQLAQIFS